MSSYIYSLQIGKVQKLDGWETGSFKEEVQQIEVFNNGINNDEVSDTKNHGGSQKAVFANSLHNYQQWQEFLALSSLPKGSLGENLTISGLDETNVFLGDIHKIGEVTLQVVQPRKPCWKISKKHKNNNFTKFIYDTGRTGWYYTILKDGKISKGDTIEVSHTNEEKISIMEANLAFKNFKTSQTTLKRILKISNISEDYKQSVQKRVEDRYDLGFMELPDGL